VWRDRRLRKLWYTRNLGVSTAVRIIIYPGSIPLLRPNHMNIVIAALLSLLPRKYRTFFTPYEIPASGAALSGILEMFTGVVLLISGYGM